ncbi:MAG: hypothetical protein J6K91_05840 [Opitutales bacterium]|nr:hypothetical protein [Opitutales bacterium]
MKKLFTIIFLSASVALAECDKDIVELVALVEQTQAVKEFTADVSLATNIKQANEFTANIEQGKQSQEITANVLLATNIKQANEQIETLETANQYISQRLFQLELHPKFMASRLAYRNTFIWYIWNDFDEAKGFNKLEIAEQIYNLTK